MFYLSGAWREKKCVNLVTYGWGEVYEIQNISKTQIYADYK